MTQVGRPDRLIAYDTDMNIARRRAGEQPVYKVIRPRTILYAAVIAVVGSVMLYGLATRATMSVNVLHERNPLFTRLSDGSVRNDYTMRFLNKSAADRNFEFTVEGLPQAVVRVIGVDLGPTTGRRSWSVPTRRARSAFSSLCPRPPFQLARPIYL